MPPLQFPYDNSAPVQFVSPGQGYYNPPPDSQAYKNTMAHVPIQSTPTKSPSQPEKARIRPLSVDEALQFSPLSSIIPFDAGMLPMPNANVQVSKSAFSNLEEKRAGNQRMHGLNQMLQTRGQTPQVLDILHGMQHLVTGKDVPKFEFKAPAPGPPTAKRKPTNVSCAAPALSPFAKLLTENTKVDFRRGPAPPSPGSTPMIKPGSSQRSFSQKPHQTPPVQRKASKSQTPGPQPQPPKTKKSASPKVKSDAGVKLSPMVSTSGQPNQATFVPNSQWSQSSPVIYAPPVPADFQSPSPSQPKPRSLPQPQAEVKVKTELSQQSPQLQKLEQMPEPNLQVLVNTIPKAEPSVHLNSQSNLQVVVPPTALSQPAVGLKTGVDSDYSDQRAAADATLRDLQDVISDVLETEADAQANGLSGVTEGIISSGLGADGDVYVLAPSVLVKLDSLLRKTIEKRRLDAVPLDQLLQLQKLCERSFSCAQNVRISLSSDWNNLEEAARNREVATCEQSLQSARIILRTMTGGRSDKQVLSEELLQQCISLLNKVVDSLIQPTVEARPTGADTAAYNTALSCKKSITSILFHCSKLMQLLLAILSKEEIAESSVNQVEYFAIRMLFVENSPTEKDSVLGIAKFEAFRRIAMLVLVEIFSRYPEQRQFIISEVLTSLQKLPTARQHGRQFKLEDGKRLQLVTVLLVRLVQASGVNTVAKSTKSLLKAEHAQGGDDADGLDSEDDDDDEPNKPQIEDSENEMDEENTDLIKPKLVRNVRHLHESAIKSAWHIVSFLVQRASTASKSGEQPHRHLLDMFVEDLIAILGLPEWPGAELLLQLLVNKMKELATGEKTNAPMKTMALETLGTLGTAILDVTFEAQSAARSLENDDSQASVRLVEQFENHMQGQLSDFDVANWKGPFRFVMDHSEKNDTHGRTNSAQGFLLTKWAKTLMWGAKGTNTEIDEDRLGGGARNLAISLSKMTLTGKWENPDPSEVSATQGRLAYLVAILHIGFCQSFSHIVSLLMGSINSDHITVRARSLKSVTQMLEKDPALLDRHRQVIGLILRCTADPSASVKDSSLALLGKCITLRPSIEREVMQAIINAASDQTVGIRKRALKLLRDAYMREDANAHQWRMTVKSLAVNSIFRRIDDEEDSVIELCQQIFEEIWMDPFRSTVETDKISATGNILMKEQMALIIQALKDHEDLSKPIEQLIRRSLSTKGKAAESSRKICKVLVACAFDGIIDSNDLPGNPAQHHILQALTVFARTEPKLFTADHIELLKPYISCLSNGDDLNLFRGVVAIFRSVLPTLPSIQQESLKKIQNDLQTAVPKLPKAELDEVASCLWTICTVLKNPERLVKLTISCLQNLQKMQSQEEMPDALVQKVQRLIRIAGHFGKYCDFQPQLEAFNKQLPSLKGELVAGKIATGIQPFITASRPLACRAVAWEGIGMICQSWPRTFSNSSISSDIQKILQEDEQALQRIILTSIRDFFTSQDQTHDTEANALSKDPLAQGKLGGSMTATDNDGAAALIAQAYLKHILRIALHTTDDIALVATEVVAGISRQGLVHPKEVGPALVALATSPGQRLVNVALQQLQSLHSQHETLFEREYMRAVHEAFVYQRDIVKSTVGYTSEQPVRAKLHHVYEVIKTSKAKFVTKFLTNICGRLDFELAKLDITAEMPAHLQYAKFLVENLVFFDFSRLDDVNHVISRLEKAVAATGSIVAHAINTELLKVTVENMLKQPEPEPEPEPAQLDDDLLLGDTLDGFLPEPILSIEPLPNDAPENDDTVEDLDPDRTRQLTTAAIILSVIWETRTFLRRLYNINPSKQNQAKNKGTKDPNKAPIKSNFVSSEKFLETVSGLVKALESRQGSVERCKKFAELMAIDDELKVANGDEDEIDAEFSGLGFDEGGVDGNSRGMKRKGSVSSSGTPRKKKSKPPRSIGGDSRKGSEDVEMWE